MKQIKSNAMPGEPEQNRLGLTGVARCGEKRTIVQEAEKNTHAAPRDNRQPEENKPCR